MGVGVGEFVRFGEPIFVGNERNAAGAQHGADDVVPVVRLVVEDAVRDGVGRIFPRPHEEVFVSGSVTDGRLDGSRVPSGADAVGHDEQLGNVVGAVICGAFVERKVVFTSVEAGKRLVVESGVDDAHEAIVGSGEGKRAARLNGMEARQNGERLMTHDFGEGLS